jgi:membrane protease YdiL (CAAX protease family)
VSSVASSWSVDGSRGARGPLVIAVVVGACATAASWLLPDGWVAAAVGGVFLGATWLLVVRRREEDVRPWGLSLGGVLEVPPAPWLQSMREALVALGWAAMLAAIIFPPFALGFVRYFHARTLGWAPPPRLLDTVLGQLVVVALPEEAFFRGYLQTALDRAWPPKFRVLGARLGAGILVSSAIFALGHLATIPAAARLAVFFPSLVFGWLRARTGGIGAGLAFHAMCNLLSDGLGRAAHL